ncbi:MAG: hypothetical protein JSS65_03000 [Armatimonadetes bacterium]|nr:hypothetical protein [Armatimonadota bacterium]
MTIEIRADGTATEKDAITDLPLESGIVPFVTISRQSTWSFADGILFLHTQKVEVEGKPDAKTKSEFADVKQDIVSQRGQSQSLRVLKVDENTFDANGNDPGTIRLHRQG